MSHVNQQSQKRIIKVISFTGETSPRFLKGMAVRMDLSFHKYGRFRVNYDGKYSEEFLKDLGRTLKAFLFRWEGKTASSTTAQGNAVLFTLKRLLTYACGGPTAGGRAEPGNTEYLMDAANGLAIEFACPQVPQAKFLPTDSEGSTGFQGFSEQEMREFRENHAHEYEA
jgi:hypothetical protein